MHATEAAETRVIVNEDSCFISIHCYALRDFSVYIIAIQMRFGYYMHHVVPIMVSNATWHVISIYQYHVALIITIIFIDSPSRVQ